jgi:hypothetical protein
MLKTNSYRTTDSHTVKIRRNTGLFGWNILSQIANYTMHFNSSKLDACNGSWFEYLNAIAYV